jgi:hypothetical protein
MTKSGDVKNNMLPKWLTLSDILAVISLLVGLFSNPEVRAWAKVPFQKARQAKIAELRENLAGLGVYARQRIRSAAVFSI